MLVREQPARRRPGRRAAGRAGRGVAPTSSPCSRATCRSSPARSSPSSARRLTDDGVLVVDDGGRDQYLLGVWRTAALRTATADVRGPTSLRRVLGAAGRHPAPARRSSRARRRRGPTATPPPTWPAPGPRPATAAAPRRPARRRCCRASRAPRTDDAALTSTFSCRRGVSVEPATPSGPAAVAVPRSCSAGCTAVSPATQSPAARVHLGGADDEPGEQPDVPRRLPHRRGAPTDTDFPADTSDKGGPAQAGSAADPAGEMHVSGIRISSQHGLHPAGHQPELARRPRVDRAVHRGVRPRRRTGRDRGQGVPARGGADRRRPRATRGRTTPGSPPARSPRRRPPGPSRVRGGPDRHARRRDAVPRVRAHRSRADRDRRAPGRVGPRHAHRHRRSPRADRPSARPPPVRPRRHRRRDHPQPRPRVRRRRRRRRAGVLDLEAAAVEDVADG